jgi:hypothetical protein
MTKTRRRTQFDALVSVYDRFDQVLRSYPEPRTEALVTNWSNWKAQVNAELQQPTVKVPRSQLAAGLKQGLRDLPDMLVQVSPMTRLALLKALRAIVEEEVPGFFAKDAQRITQIVRRGRIRTESEWDVMRHRVDEIEGDLEHAEEMKTLYTLLDRYERIA